MSTPELEKVLKNIAKELGDNGYCSYIAIEEVLKARLLPLLEEGQEMRNVSGSLIGAGWDTALEAAGKR